MDENTRISLKNTFWLIGIVIAAFLGWRQMEKAANDRMKANEDRQAALESRVAALETYNAIEAQKDDDMKQLVKQNNEMLSQMARGR